jgi:hypothetical protein
MNHDRSTRHQVPIASLVFAALIGCVILVVVTAAVIAVPALRPTGALLATTCCFCAALIFAFIWPANSWQWGVWLSAGFWLYFVFVFVAIWLNGKVDWLPAIYATSVLVSACVGGFVGQRLSFGMQKQR